MNFWYCCRILRHTIILRRFNSLYLKIILLWKSFKTFYYNIIQYKIVLNYGTFEINVNQCFYSRLIFLKLRHILKNNLLTLLPLYLL